MEEEVKIYFSGTQSDKIRDVLKELPGVKVLDEVPEGGTGFVDFDLGPDPMEHPEDTSVRDGNKPFYRDFVSGRRKGKFKYR